VLRATHAKAGAPTGKWGAGKKYRHSHRTEPPQLPAANEEPNNGPGTSETSEAKKSTHQSSYYNHYPLPNQEAEAGVD